MPPGSGLRWPGSVPGPVVTGELDFRTPTARVAAESGSLFPVAARAVLPGAGHYPWLDEPAAFTAVIGKFLAAPEPPA
jgi:pimeloyl-ACP methyl ester carboxylesterase